jgi:hypothetical protein
MNGTFDSARQHYTVEMDDGQIFEVHTDGRDWAAMEAKQFPPGSLVTAVRFLAYNAAKREGLVRMSWEQFNLTKCVLVDLIGQDDTDDEDSEGEKGLDPGRPTTNEPAESTSRSSAVNRTRARPVS